MWKVIAVSVWEFVKIAFVMVLALSWMRGAVQFGATPLEAGFAAVVASVIWAAYLICKIIGTAADSFHPKMDEMLSELRDIRHRSN